MRKAHSRHRATVASPNGIKDTFRDIQHIFKTDVPELEANTLNDFEKSNLIQRHNSIIECLVVSICTESGMDASDIAQYVKPAFAENGDSVTIELNFTKFGRVGVEVYDGSTDAFSSTDNIHRFRIPTQDESNKNWDNFENEYRNSLSGDSVAVALNFTTYYKKIRMDIYVFDRPNEVLTEPIKRTTLQRILGVEKPQIEIR